MVLLSPSLSASDDWAARTGGAVAAGVDSAVGVGTGVGESVACVDGTVTMVGEGLTAVVGVGDGNSEGIEFSDDPGDSPPQEVENRRTAKHSSARDGSIRFRERWLLQVLFRLSVDFISRSLAFLTRQGTGIFPMVIEKSLEHLPISETWGNPPTQTLRGPWELVVPCVPVNCACRRLNSTVVGIIVSTHRDSTAAILVLNQSQGVMRI